MDNSVVVFRGWSLWLCCLTATMWINVGSATTVEHTVPDEMVSAQRGQPVVLTCPIDVKSCGELHSVKWFKGNDRVAVVSGDGVVENVEGQFSGRMTIGHNPLGPSSTLNLKNAEVPDEDTYVCETTFLEPMENCDNTGSFSIGLQVHVPPATVRMVDDSSAPIANDTTLGPLREGHRFAATCEVLATRPSPLVAWYRAGHRVPDSLSTDHDEPTGLYSVRSALSVVLSRAELAATYECRVETPAVAQPLRQWLHVNLQVRPTKIQMTGLVPHLVQGTIVQVICLVSGARPAANITWYNNTTPLEAGQLPAGAQMAARSISTKQDVRNDGTFTTLSKWVFTATRFENGMTVRCEADNVVMRDEAVKSLKESFRMEVLYPPVVSVRARNVTVNETGEFSLDCDYDANPSTLKNVKWLRDGTAIDLNQGRVEPRTQDRTKLLVKGANRDDSGSYTCELENKIGRGSSEAAVEVDVNYVPVVELTMEPNTTIIENSESNVTLFCNVVRGSPSVLRKVRWYLDGQILKELPECATDSAASGPDEDGTLCGVNPNVLLLENVGREFLGNYSCEGENAAGWGRRSRNTELQVHYEPGNATLAVRPLLATKRKPVTFTCTVDDLGNPPATRYRWLRGGSPVMDVVSHVWTVDAVGLDSRTNFSCFAYNAGGRGTAATVQLDVTAPQAFIQKLHPYTGALFSSPTVQLQCRVECVPACTIDWFKDGVGIEAGNERYYVRESYLPAEPAVGDFESVLSVLHFNVSAWPERKFDRLLDNANYSCASSSRTDGPGVRSATFFGVEYPPENTTLSNASISVELGAQPPRVSCSAKAYPEPSYEWRRRGNVIAKGNVLYIFRNMSADDAGAYECVAFNKHGNSSTALHVNVLYRPNCTIVRKEINAEDTLACIAVGNPPEIHFAWTMRSENETVLLPEVRKSQTSNASTSFMLLDADFAVQRTFRCMTNNSLGAGQWCEIDVAGHILWWQRLDKLTLYVLLSVLIALLLIVIVVCIIIICICRKRRRQNKYHTDLSISATQSDLLCPTKAARPQRTPAPSATTAAAASAEAPQQLQQQRFTTPPSSPRPPPPLLLPPPPPEIPKSPPKWPLRPGVMVHVRVDTKQNLCAARAQSPPALPQPPPPPPPAIVQATPTTATSKTPLYASPKQKQPKPPLSTTTTATAADVAAAAATLSSAIALQPTPAPSSNVAVADAPADEIEVMAAVLSTPPHHPSPQPSPMPSQAPLPPPPPPPRNFRDKPAPQIATNRLHQLLQHFGVVSTAPSRQPTSSTSSETEATVTGDEIMPRSRFLQRLLQRWSPRRRRSAADAAATSGGGVDAAAEVRGARRSMSFIRRSVRLFGSGKSTNSGTALFDRRHHLAGITSSSDGVVTYKRTPTAGPVRPPVADAIHGPPPDAATASASVSGPVDRQHDSHDGHNARTGQPVSGCSSSHSANISAPPPLHRTLSARDNSTSMLYNDKSSVAGDPLTAPGEYEIMSFPGISGGPHKFCPSGAGTNKRDVVRVAPLSKPPGAPYSYNLANSFPASSYSAATNNFHHAAATAEANGSSSANTTTTSLNTSTSAATNYPSFQITSMNYTSFPPSDGSGGPTAAAPPQQPHHQTSHPGGGHSSDRSDAFASAKHSLRGGSGGFLSAATVSAFNPFLSKSRQAKQRNSGGAGSEPRFNSLKSLGCRKTNEAFHSMRSTGKCKRHHSIVNGGGGGGPGAGAAIVEAEYDPQPLYENLTDSIQIHEASLPFGGGGGGVADVEELLQQQQQQQRHSLYRSDSGISNSSYECVTPVPAPRRNPRKCQSVPVYMNLPGRGERRADGGGVRASKRCRGGGVSTAGGAKGVASSSRCGRETSNGAVYSYERTQTNPFIAPSLRHPSSSSSSNACNPDQPPATATTAFAGRSGSALPHMVQSSSSSSTASAASSQQQLQQHRRPVRLPLRKHHTFHFQSSQTVAGAHHHRSGRANQAPPQQHQPPSSGSLVPGGSAAARRHYRVNGGPLVFKPFSEETAFKPITPVPKSPPGQAQSYLCASHTMPRNGNAGLRRHTSNVETAASVAAATASHRRRHRSGQHELMQDCDGGDIDFDVNHDEEEAGDFDYDDDDDEDGAEDSTPSSSASARTAAAHLAANRKLHYADLTPLQCRSDGSSAGSGSTTGHGRASTAPVTTSSTSSTEEAQQHQQQFGLKMAGRGGLSGRNQAIEECGPTLKTTQYATLKYSEVNM